MNIFPEDVAEAIFFLASPAASKITGAALTVDGGCSLCALRHLAVDLGASGARGLRPLLGEIGYPWRSSTAEGWSGSSRGPPSLGRSPALAGGLAGAAKGPSRGQDGECGRLGGGLCPPGARWGHGGATPALPGPPARGGLPPGAGTTPAGLFTAARVYSSCPSTPFTSWWPSRRKSPPVGGRPTLPNVAGPLPAALGVAANGWTNASTTQLAEPWQRTWAKDLLEALGLPLYLFVEPVLPGTVLGDLREALARELGQGFAVVASARHDTASAVAAVPAESQGWAYLIAGTWTLLGVERNVPLVDARAFAYQPHQRRRMRRHRPPSEERHGPLAPSGVPEGLERELLGNRLWAGKSPFRFVLDPDREEFLPLTGGGTHARSECRRYPGGHGQACRAAGRGSPGGLRRLSFRYRQVLGPWKR